MSCSNVNKAVLVPSIDEIIQISFHIRGSACRTDYLRTTLRACTCEGLIKQFKAQQALRMETVSTTCDDTRLCVFNQATHANGTMVILSLHSFLENVLPFRFVQKRESRSL